MTHVNNQFWEDVAAATDLVMNSGARRIDGEGFKVYTIPGSGITRIDIPKATTPKEGTHDRAHAQA